MLRFHKSSSWLIFSSLQYIVFTREWGGCIIDEIKLGRRYNCNQCIDRSKNVGLLVCFEVQNQRYKSIFLPWLISDFSIIFLNAWNIMGMQNDFKSFAVQKL